MPALGKVIPFHACAACGADARGSGYSVHRDGFGIGPEVPLCRACGAGETPTLEDIWTRIAARRVESR